MDLEPGLPAAYRHVGNASFSDFLRSAAPDLLPENRLQHLGAGSESVSAAPVGTTIVATRFRDGVVLAGDRRATIGNVIAQRDIQKVFAADDMTGIGIAGSAGIAMDLVRLFQVELEHYEKIEGTRLSTEGKANRLGSMLRGNLGLALQGLAAMPLLAGYDIAAGRGRIFSYDLTGGRYEEHDFHAIGSGAQFARGSMKKLHDPAQDRGQAVEVVLQALFDAADDDSATAGPDLYRRIFPIVAVITETGYSEVDDVEREQLVNALVDVRLRRPDGPLAAIGAGSSGAGSESTGNGGE